MAGDSKEERIISAALKLFSSKGYSKTTVSQIANEANVAKGTVYWYFDSKKELFHGIIISRMDNLRNEIEATLESKSTVKDKLEVLTRFYLKFFESNQQVARMYQENPGNIGPSFKEEVMKLKQGHINLIATIIGEGLENSELKSELNINALAHIFSGIITSFNPHFYTGDDLDLDVKVDTVMEVFLRGISKVS